MMNHDAKVLSPKEVAVQYGLNTGTLANLRSQSRGCRYYKRGRRVYYKIEDVEKWMFANPVLTIDSVDEGRCP